MKSELSTTAFVLWAASHFIVSASFADRASAQGRCENEIAVGLSAAQTQGFRWLVFGGKESGFERIGGGGEEWGGSRYVTAINWAQVDGDPLPELIVGRNQGDGPRWIVYDDIRVLQFGHFIHFWMIHISSDIITVHSTKARCMQVK